mmetsp:Transcript_46630/g.101240  ORF Transcript_46630/g.101240 Transcript_46630/m.101240 type:complete len:204 (-) Transcript_46630:169-780(-)
MEVIRCSLSSLSPLASNQALSIQGRYTDVADPVNRARSCSRDISSSPGLSASMTSTIAAPSPPMLARHSGNGPSPATKRADRMGWPGVRHTLDSSIASPMLLTPPCITDRRAHSASTAATASGWGVSSTTTASGGGRECSPSGVQWRNTRRRWCSATMGQGVSVNSVSRHTMLSASNCERATVAEMVLRWSLSLLVASAAGSR